MPRGYVFKKSIDDADCPSLAAMEIAFPIKPGNLLRDMKSHPANLPYFPSPNTPWPAIGLPTANVIQHDHLYPRQPLATKNPDSIWTHNNFPPFSNAAYITCAPHTAPHWSTVGSPFQPYHGNFATPPPSTGIAHLYATAAERAQIPYKPKVFTGGSTRFDIDTILGHPRKKVTFDDDDEMVSNKLSDDDEPKEIESVKSRLNRRLGGKILQRYHCQECNKSYSTSSGLAKHQEFHCNMLHHQTFRCKFCNKNYGTHGALKMHNRTHTLPNQCTVCGRRFSRPWLLQGHMRTHSGEKPFQCEHCHRPFADKSNLRAHLQTHADIKKYKCQICLKTFSRMSLLNKHQSGSCRMKSSSRSAAALEGTLV